MSDEKKIIRKICSFVRREGRLTASQARALETLLPEVEIPFQETAIDIRALFPNAAGVHLDIGFGHGESLLTAAAAHPTHHFIGIEVYRPGIGAFLIKMAEAQLGNVSLICHDAVDVLQQMIPSATLESVSLFFPDPWPKQRHQKRRIVQPAFAQLICDRLQPGGLFHLATDWQHYAKHMLTVLNAVPGFRNMAADNTYIPRPEARPLTKFERRGERLGHEVWDLCFVRASA
jgi:tRNA (guanine-N7-)-methyltransferase